MPRLSRRENINK
ncbi:hypothetical protein A2U01_0051382, partial [Trifolium medium]|nr:hypothetical protein [Trifolium medium]